MPPIRPAPPSTPRPLTAATNNGKLEGTAPAGTTVVEVVNLSTAAALGKTASDTFISGTVDAQGRFTAPLPDVQGGDLLRLRTRDGSGKVGNWLSIRAAGADTRPATVNVNQVALKDNGNGVVTLGNRDAQFPVGDPEAFVEVRNTRSGETALFQLDATGNIPPEQTIPGHPQDTFTFATSDGTHNDALDVIAGKLTLPGTRPVRDLEDPKVHSKYNQASGGVQAKQRYSGPLFVDGVSPNDVKQGYLGDCYLCAGAAALAQRAPKELMNAMKDNGDGTYTVTFKVFDPATRSYRNKPITVDGELYTGYNGPLYAKSTGDTNPQKMELWVPILEKAYAAFKGSYDAMGSGGQAHELFTAITGKPGRNVGITPSQDSLAWLMLKGSVDRKEPCVASTPGESTAADFTNSGVHADHAYTVLDAFEKDGKKYVKLRNPWGHGEPYGHGPDDGVFDLPLEQFMKLFKQIHSYAR